MSLRARRRPALAGPLATVARGDLERVTVRQGPLTVPPYGVRFTSRRTREVRAPRLDGWLVRMHARVVDAKGRPIPVREVMLHHVVYKNRSRRDPVCGGPESFYGTGEENQTLRLPPGYGYRVRRRDRWSTGWMLMNHRDGTRRAYIEYTSLDRDVPQAAAGRSRTGSRDRLPWRAGPDLQRARDGRRRRLPSRSSALMSPCLTAATSWPAARTSTAARGRCV